jgi:Domain of unknown function (DUF1707)
MRQRHSRVAALRLPCIVLTGRSAAVTAGPGREKAAVAAGRGYLRASHADREDVIGALKAAFVQGRLTKEEFDVRVARVLASRTYADLAALTVGLGAGVTGAPRTGETRPAQAQSLANKTLMWGMCVIIVVAIGAIATPPLMAVGVLAILIAAPIAGTLMLDSWREKRSRGRTGAAPAQHHQGRLSRTGDQAMHIPWLAREYDRTCDDCGHAWRVPVASESRCK